MNSFPKPLLGWPRHFAHVAARDGWRLCWDNGAVRLEPHREKWWRQPPSFHSNDAVRVYVRDQARAGSPVAQAALKILKECSMEEYIMVMGSDDE